MSKSAKLKIDMTEQEIAQLHAQLRASRKVEEASGQSRVTAENLGDIMHYVSTTMEGSSEREYAQQHTARYRTIQHTFLSPETLELLRSRDQPTQPRPSVLQRRRFQRSA